MTFLLRAHHALILQWIPSTAAQQHTGFADSSGSPLGAPSDSLAESWPVLLGALVALARTEMWSQPPCKQRSVPGVLVGMTPSLSPLPQGPAWSRHHPILGPRIPSAMPTHPDAVVPALALRLGGPHPSTVAHSAPTEAVAALHLVSNDPDLVQGPHRHRAHVVGHVNPAAALGVAGSHSLAVPQVPWGDRDRVTQGSLEDTPSTSLPTTVPQTTSPGGGPGAWPIRVLQESPKTAQHSPFSSKANTDVCPTDTCFSLCLGGDGMWYQQSPAMVTESYAVTPHPNSNCALGDGSHIWGMCLAQRVVIHMNPESMCRRTKQPPQWDSVGSSQA